MNLEFHITSRLGLAPNIGRRRGSCADYNGNNTWYFNGTNGCLNNNNNRYNGNFRCRPVLDYGQYDNSVLEDYPLPLSYLLVMSLQTEKGKRRKPSYVFFVLHRIEELVKLCHEMNNCEVLPREGTAHIVHEPKVREIVCSSTAKKVMQTFYITQMLPFLEQQMYHPDSYSCRRGKGGLRAVQQLREYIYEQSNGHTEPCYVAKVDIQAFFMSIDCHEVCDTVQRFIDEKMALHPYRELLKYLTRIIYLAATKDHIKDMASPDERALLDPRKSILNQPYYQSLPIGDCGSQTGGLIVTTGALLYLASLGYRFVHYTDDTAVVVTDRERWLRDDLPRLEWYYATCHNLTLHPKKRYFQHHSKGVELLGYKLRYERILPSKRVCHNMMWYLERTIRQSEKRTWIESHKEQIRDSLNSYLGMLRHCNAYKLRRSVCKQVEQSPLAHFFEVVKGYTKVVIRPQHTTEAYYRREYKHLKNNVKLIAL